MRMRVLTTAAVVLMATGGLVASQAQAGAPADYGPGVALLQHWYDTGTRGDLAGDADLLTKAKTVARSAIGKPRVTLQGPAVVAFAIATPTGAVAYVVQHATDTRGGETDIAQGVSLPVGAAIWFDHKGSPVNRLVDFPVSQAESGTTPDDAALTSGMWTTRQQEHFVLFDTEFATQLRDGVLSPRFSSPRDLVRATDWYDVDFGGTGFALVSPGPAVLTGTAELELDQPDGLSNHPALRGGPWDWRSRLDEGRHDVFPLDLYFEGLESSTPLRIHPFEAAYGGHQATRLAKTWTKERISLRTALWGSPLQAKIPGGPRVLMRNVVWGKAYVALVRFGSGKVVGVRCTTPGPVLTASCALPRRLGRLFVVDEKFSWRKGDREWVAAKPPRHLSITHAAIVPPGSTIRVDPDPGKPFVLYR